MVVLLPQNASSVEYSFLACKSGSDALSQTSVLGYPSPSRPHLCPVSLYWPLLTAWKPSHSFPGQAGAGVTPAQDSKACLPPQARWARGQDSCQLCLTQHLQADEPQMPVESISLSCWPELFPSSSSLPPAPLPQPREALLLLSLREPKGTCWLALQLLS